MIRVIEDIYRDYENPRRAELNLQAFLNDHPDENDWDETDYERYYDLKDRVRFAWNDDEFDSMYESKLTESDFTGDPLLPDVKDVYEELIRMYDVRKDVGYVETVKKMLASIGGKANVNAFRSNTFGDDRMVIDWIVKDGEFKYTGRSYISDDSYGQWLFFIEDLCMAYYKSLGGKGGYTPDLIKAIGKGY